MAAVDNDSTLTQFDLSTILGNNQQANLDDFVEFEIFFDHLSTKPLQLCVSLEQEVVPRYLEESYESSHDKTSFSCSASQTSLFNRLLNIYDFLVPFIKAYSWTCSTFFLTIETPDDKPPYLRGRLRVGDNLQEEWLVAQLLVDISNHFPDCSINVWDIDGNFLLIEAANVLPAWLSPETAANRCFIRKGVFCLLPRELPVFNDAFKNISGAIDVDAVLRDTTHNREILVPSVEDALKCLRADQLSFYVARPLVQKRIFNRLRGFAAVKEAWLSAKTLSSAENLTESSICAPHYCRIIVPAVIGMLLKEYPNLLGVALDHLPPPSDFILKWKTFQKKIKNEISDVAQALPSFDCSSQNASTVQIRLALNRCQFARLNQLRFRPPAQFLASQWRLPVTGKTLIRGQRHLSEKKDSSHRYVLAMERGAKVCLGLLCAYLLDSKKLSGLLPFFWCRSANCGREALERFFKLLCDISESESSTNITTNKEIEVRGRKTQKHCKETSFLSQLLSLHALIHSVFDVNCTHRMTDDTLLSRCTFQNALNHLMRTLPQNYELKGFCSCVGEDCKGVNCSCDSDDEDWSSLATEDVEKMIADRQGEDLLRNLIKKELKGKSAIPNIQQSIQAGSDKIDAELEATLTKFKNFLNVSSDYEGIDSGFCSDERPERLDMHTREIIRERYPDIADMFDELADEEIGSSPESLHENDSVDSEEKSEVSMDAEMQELMKAMDEELSKFVTKNSKNMKKTSYDADDPEDSPSSDDDENFVKDENFRPFRSEAPADLSDQQLADVLSSNLSTSRRLENLLEPGPASLLMKSVDTSKQ